MHCVLLAALELRAVQLHLEPDIWMTTAMYLTVFSVVTQAVWVSVIAAMNFLPQTEELAAAEAICEACLFEKARPFDAHELEHTYSADLGCRCSEDGLGCDAGGVQQVATKCGLGTVLAVLYAGTAAMLLSVFAMEEQPSSLLVGFMAFSGSGEQGALDLERDSATDEAAPPLSLAMRCTMLLTVLYFASDLCVLLAHLVPGNPRRWAKAVNESLQSALAFVPMLCVLLIAVRLRAMQLRVRDPQPWAQAAMCNTTIAIVTQVVCCLLVGAGGASVVGGREEDTFDDDCATSKALRASHLGCKAFAIVLLVVQHLAALVLYCGIAALVVALLCMEPALAL